VQDVQEKIAVVGLGYVGLPLAVAFSRKFETIGFDISQARVNELANGYDATLEVGREELSAASIQFTTEVADLKAATAIIVTVPTPINDDKTPDLTPLQKSSSMIGEILQEGQLVVYESTVYPGLTEKYCLPILEEKSGLSLGQFSLGYSPERINPGDKQHTLEKIKKVVSGHDAAACDRVAAIYESIITAGIHRAPNIMTAEASKVIENVQRDLNIAFMNELSKIFDRIGIHTREVLAAAGTKWNFHPYFPGLVGGHCIGVDPYYLTHLAESLGYDPEVILSGRRINDSMGEYVANLAVRELKACGRDADGARILLLGMTFKENVPDMRNSLAENVHRQFKNLGCEVYVWEPLVEDSILQEKYGYQPATLDNLSDLDAVMVINNHNAFKSITLTDLKSHMRTPVLIDLKELFDRQEAAQHGFHYVSL
jgi:UDP-N-acetyl-D-galactosamine dehydrogenase